MPSSTRRPSPNPYGRAGHPIPPDMLDLDASPPPGLPRYMKATTLLNCRVPTPTAARFTEQARRRSLNVNQLLKVLVERELDGTGPYPPDVQRWLDKQAAQCGIPGQAHEALIRVIRHLAARWPDGGRLNEPTNPPAPS